MMLRLLNREPLPYPEEEHKDFNSFLGLEVELEGSKQSPKEWNIDFTVNLGAKSEWSCVSDGSLKNKGVEFIFQNPECGKSVETALDQLEWIKKENGKPFLTSERTSIHVHVDVSDLTIPQFRNFLVLSMVLEHLMYLAVGKNRYINNNCSPITNNNNYHEIIKHLYSYELIENAPGNVREMFCESLKNLCLGVQKYTGINTSSVFKKIGYDEEGMRQYRGSLEFRMHSGTVSVQRIRDWLKFLCTVKSAAKTLKEDELIMNLSVKGYRTFLEDLIGINSTLWLKRRIRSEELIVNSLYNSIRELQLIKSESLLNQFESELFQPIHIDQEAI